jgi:hypothetical protein
LKNPDATRAVERIVRASREEGRDRDIYKQRLLRDVVVNAAITLQDSEKGRKLGLKFEEDEMINAAGRLLRLGYRLDGPKSRLRCNGQTPCEE